MPVVPKSRPRCVNINARSKPYFILSSHASPTSSRRSLLLTHISGSAHLTQQLLLQNELPLLILLRALIRAIVLPAHNFFALPAVYVAHDVAAGGHVALAGFALLDVDYGVEEVGFAVLAAEVLRARVVSTGCCEVVKRRKKESVLCL